MVRIQIPENEEKAIVELRDLIDESAKKVRIINPDLIGTVDIYDPENVYCGETTPFARELIEKYDIVLYLLGEEDEPPIDIVKILRSQTTREFIKNLAEYEERISAYAREVEYLEEIEEEERKRWYEYSELL